MSEIILTHLWVKGFGWENTIFNPSDFEEVKEFGTVKEDGQTIFECVQENGVLQIAKGDYKLA